MMFGRLRWRRGGSVENPWRELADYQPIMQKRLPDIRQTFLYIFLSIKRLAPRPPLYPKRNRHIFNNRLITILSKSPNLGKPCQLLEKAEGQ